MKTKKFLGLGFLVGLGAFLAKPVLAICPICTVAVGTGVGLSRWLGVDDLISGIWIGGLILSTIYWTWNWMDKKEWRGFWWKGLVFISWYLLIIIPLYWQGIMGHGHGEILGVDRLLMGIILGSLAFILAERFHFFLKKKNEEKVYFPFQKVIIPVGALLILSILFYFFPNF